MSAADRSLDLAEISRQVGNCRLCKLGEHARAVPGEGSPNASVLFVGEAPGFYEDQQGRPFVGPAGQLLDEMLKVAGLARKDVYITNVIKHRPPGNRDPEPDEIEACEGYLRAQIAAIQPQVIVTLGRYSMARFFPNIRSMAEAHGRAMAYNGLMVYPVYHPAAALRQGRLKEVLEQDFRALPMIIARAKERALAPSSTRGLPGAPAQEPATLVEAAPEQMSLW